jgi:RNA polymerase sigma-54 factor
MALSMKQGMAVEQTLNPKMIAFYELLQRPVTELNQAIEAELEENPALEITAERLCPACGSAMLSDVCRECGYRPGPDEAEFSHSPSDVSIDPTPASKTQNFVGEDEFDDPLARLAAPETLSEHLHWAWRLQGKDSSYDLGCSIIGCLNDDGYLEEGLEPLAEGLGVPEEELEKVLLEVQQLDPPGVGARNLRECLRLQLENFVTRDNEKDSEKELAALALRMVDKQWHAMTRHAYEEIARKMRLPLERVQEVADFVRHRITPYPGRQFRPEWQTQSNGQARLRPDVTIAKNENGGYEVIVRESRSLGLRINGIYRKLWDSMRREPDTYSSKDREHVQQYLTRAREFIDNLNQRRKTLKLIIEAVARQQGEFLEQDLHAMKPLTRLSVAHELGLHESTVGRAVSGKFAQIPTGAIVPCEIFFDSSLAVKEVMKDVLAQEDPRKPYSDEKIARLLEERGIEIARRTVTKYREALKILPAAQRRRYD